MPGNRTASSISDRSSSHVIPSRHSSSGFRAMVVSNMARGAGSVAVLARPAFPNTDCTSGKLARMLSCLRMASWAARTLIPGSVMGMYRIVPSFRGGMNSDPILWRGIVVRIRMARAPPTTGHRH